MDAVENTETSQSPIEKPKRRREPTPAQLENLAKMRTKRQINAAARKMLAEKPTSAPTPTPAPQTPAPAPARPTSAPEPAEVLRVADDVRYIREYIATKKAAKEAKTAARQSVDMDTHDEELQRYKAYTSSLRNNLLR